VAVPAWAEAAVAVTKLKTSRMHTPTLFLLALGATLGGVAQAENTISYQTYKYTESNDRMAVRAGDLSVEKDFGTDVTARFDIGTDAISGATPCWTAKTGYVNAYASGKCAVADETRNSASAGLTWRDTLRNEYTFGVASSREPDFVSNEFSGQAQFWHDEAHNRSYTIGLGLQDNTAVATAHTNNSTNRGSKAWSLQVGANQVLDRTSTVEGSLYAGHESGYLSNHYLKIVRDNGSGQNTLVDESRPDLRSSGGFALRYIKAWSSDFKTNLWYRFYGDNWGITSHTVEAKAYWDINAQWRLNPVLRLFQQSSADFYRAYGDSVNTFASTGYGSNDARLGSMRAGTVQLNVEYHASKEWTLNTGLVHYKQNTGLTANWLTAGFVFKY
jgi:hypothetical protein